jgi:hypothetical protein
MCGSLALRHAAVAWGARPGLRKSGEAGQRANQEEDKFCTYHHELEYLHTVISTFEVLKIVFHILLMMIPPYASLPIETGSESSDGLSNYSLASEPQEADWQPGGSIS